MRSLSLMSFLTVIMLGSTGARSADSPSTTSLTYLACEIGVNDYRNLGQCGAVDALVPCGYTANQIAEQICNIYTPSGTVNVPYGVAEISDPGGGQCGYARFSVTCNLPAGYTLAYNTKHNGVNVGCGQSYGTLAANYCANRKPPSTDYGWFFNWYQGGGSCGFTQLDVLCYN
jgi:hypothetical protein